MFFITFIKNYTMKNLERFKYMIFLLSSIGIYFVIIQTDLIDRESTIGDEFLTSGMFCWFGYSVIKFYQTFKN